MMLSEFDIRFFSRMESLLDGVPAQTDHSYKLALIDSLLAYSGASDSLFVSRRVSEIISAHTCKAES